MQRMLSKDTKKHNSDGKSMKRMYALNRHKHIQAYHAGATFHQRDTPPPYIPPPPVMPTRLDIPQEIGSDELSCVGDNLNIKPRKKCSSKKGSILRGLKSSTKKQIFLVHIPSRGLESSYQEAIFFIEKE